MRTQAANACLASGVFSFCTSDDDKSKSGDGMHCRASTKTSRFPLPTVAPPPWPPGAGAQRTQVRRGPGRCTWGVPTAAQPLPAAHCPCDWPGCGWPPTWGGAAAHTARDTAAGDGAGWGVPFPPFLSKAKQALTVSAAETRHVQSAVSPHLHPPGRTGQEPRHCLPRPHSPHPAPWFSVWVWGRRLDGFRG